MQNLLQHIHQYVKLTAHENQSLQEACKELQLKKKAFLLSEGEVCSSNYFVSQGCLRMYFIKENGTEQITQFAIENWWMSDYMSLSKNIASPFFIQAIEDCRIIQIPRTSLEPLLGEVPKLERYFRLVIQQAYAASQFRIKFLYEYSREEHYRHFSSQFPDFVQRVPQYMLASFLGFTPEYLSEIRKKI